MRRASFRIDDLKPIIEHTKAQDEHHWPYGLIPQGEPENAPPGLYLVKDAGIYLMSNAKEKLLDPDRPSQLRVAYAVGLNPHKDGDVWQACRDIAGGDDFVELLPMEDIENTIGQSKTGQITIEFTDTTLSLIAA